MAAMKRTYYYTFFPTKEEETNAVPCPTGAYPRVLVEIRDDNPNPNPAMLLPNSTTFVDPNTAFVNPWRIRKQLETHEIATGKIHLTHDDVFEHVFRYSSLESANMVIAGNKVYVSVCDLTDESTPLMYGPYDEQTFFEKGLQDEYVLGVNSALVRSREFKKDDEIGIYYEPRTHTFYFKAFR